MTLCNRKEMLKILCIAIISIPIYLLIEYSFGIKFNVVNLFILFFAIILTCIGAVGIRNNGVLLYNIFLLSFFGVLTINTFNLSYLQMEKSFLDFYYYFFGPLLFTAILFISERKSVTKTIVGLKANPNVVGIIIAILCIISKYQVFSKTGIRAFSNLWLSSQSDSFVVQGQSGIAYILMWLCVMMIPVVNKKTKALLVIVPITISILSAKRGDLIRLVIFLLILWMAKYGNRFVNKKNVIRLGIISLCILIGFSFYGNYRQEKRGWTTTIGTSLESRVNNDVVNWVYSYTAINFDVLKLYIAKEPTGECKQLLVPILRIIYGSSAIDDYYSGLYIYGLNGFNAGTFLESFIGEMGVFYFWEIIVLGVLVAILNRICLIVKFMGGHLFLILLTALCVFGNYYSISVMLYALIAGIIIYLLIDLDREKSNPYFQLLYKPKGHLNYRQNLGLQEIEGESE